MADVDRQLLDAVAKAISEPTTNTFEILNRIFDAGNRQFARPRFLPVGECVCCDENRFDFAPAHFASDRCESGKHNHCSCDICF